ncbi:MAG: hypothetical protein E7157_01525 [Lactobacillales bacterium]|nr:hypothetical protein [Lactobacillales bacterium]
MRRLLIISLCFLLVVGCGCNKKENSKTKKEELPFDVNFDLSKETTINGLKISNIQVIVDEKGISHYTANVTNTTDSVYKLNQINMIIKNKEGNKVATLMGYIGSNIAPGESRILNVNTDIDLMSGYEIEYEIKK